MATFVMNCLYFPVISLFFPVPDPSISAYVIGNTQFFIGFGCRPAPIYRDLQAGKPKNANPAQSRSRFGRIAFPSLASP